MWLTLGVTSEVARERAAPLQIDKEKQNLFPGGTVGRFGPLHVVGDKWVISKPVQGVRTKSMILKFLTTVITNSVHGMASLRLKDQA